MKFNLAITPLSSLDIRLISDDVIMFGSDCLSFSPLVMLETTLSNGEVKCRFVRQAPNNLFSFYLRICKREMLFRCLFSD